MRGRERESERIKESERAREPHRCIVARRVVLSCRYVCRMHSCVSMTALHSGGAKQVCRFANFRFLPSQRCAARPRCSPWPKVLAKGRCAVYIAHTGGYPHRTKRDAGRCPRGSSKARGVAEHAGLAWYCWHYHCSAIAVAKAACSAVNSGQKLMARPRSMAVL